MVRKKGRKLWIEEKAPNRSETGEDEGDPLPFADGVDVVAQNIIERHFCCQTDSKLARFSDALILECLTKFR